MSASAIWDTLSSRSDRRSSRSSLTLSELVLVSRNEIGGHWVLSLILQDPRFTEVFLRLVAHLVAALAEGADAGGGLGAVDEVLR